MRLRATSRRALGVAWAVAGLTLGLTLAWLLARAWPEVRTFVEESRGVRIVETSPDDGEVVAATAWIELRFSRPVEAGRLEGLVSIEPAVPGRLEVESESARWISQPALQPGIDYLFNVAPGPVAEDGEATLSRGIRVRFSVRPPALTYLSPAEAPSALWLVPPGGEAPPEALASPALGVVDYAVSRDGEVVAYIVPNQAGGSDVWIGGRSGGQGRLLVDCGPEVCTEPAWAPDGRRLAFTRRAGEAAPEWESDQPSLWTVDVGSGEAGALYRGVERAGEMPNWSPDGERLAFYDRRLDGIVILDLQIGEEQILPTEMGLTGAWSPDGGSMLFTVFNLVGGASGSVLYRLDLESRRTSMVVGEESGWADISVPAWSPVGEWVAMAAQPLEGGLAKSLWIMRPDGSGRQPVSVLPGLSHGGYAWDPWGRRLVFQRFRLGREPARPEVAIWDRERGSVRLIAEDAFAPAWLP